MFVNNMKPVARNYEDEDFFEGKIVPPQSFPADRRAAPQPSPPYAPSRPFVIRKKVGTSRQEPHRQNQNE